MRRTDLGLALLATLLASACADPGHAPTPAAFADQLCSLLQPCCGAAGLPTDGVSCHGVMDLAAASSPFDAASAETCLADMRRAQADGTLCGGTTSDACARAFPSGGTVAPGGACSRSEECAPSAAGHVDCLQWFPAGAATVSGVCTVQRLGQAGDQPCAGDLEGSVRWTSWTSQATPPAEVVLCDRASGVICGAAQTCVPLTTTGGACLSSETCQAGAFCDLFGLVCTARVGQGAPCTEDQACQDAFYCGPTSSSCAPRRADGATCAVTSECALASACSAGVCRHAPDLGLVLLCGGT
jgi:hypothetical protein